MLKLLEEHAGDEARVLDPFCGTGTTALVCAELGLPSYTTDINPFLVWLTEAKARAYSTSALTEFRSVVDSVAEAFLETGSPPWVPRIHNINRWWNADTLSALGHGIAQIEGLDTEVPRPVSDLLKVVFCRTLIDRANVSFGHQSMSFGDGSNGDHPSLFPEKRVGVRVAEVWNRHVKEVGNAALSTIRKEPTALLCDARDLTAALPRDHFTCVITSPPYANRMSYIRELRPYMYWLRYLVERSDAGELDWKAIGGTWGRATSNLNTWKPSSTEAISFPHFAEILRGIATESELLSRYVHKYFEDMAAHAQELFQLVASGGTIHFIVGNSKFYDVVVPVQDIYAALFRDVGFSGVKIDLVRKRNSKKELFEYLVSARKD